jgi:hypothetical protein
MESESINASLQRPLKSGLKYNKYFEKVSCEATFLGKGNTTFGLQQMKSWAKKYQHQTKEISKVLANSSKHITISSIKSFLYDHLQYQIDGYNQQLRSPACSWSARKSGIDCKSYSLFASTILLNLGIKHSFRKIKQPGLNPTQWSHVYVIIPDGNKQYVIDGTIKDNNELPFLEKEDLFMEAKLPYYGLNAAAPVQISTRDSEILEGFKQIIQIFSKIGVSPAIINAVENKVQEAYYKYNSFQFPFRLSPNNVLLIDNEQIVLLPQGLNEPRQAVRAISTNVASIDTSMFQPSTPQGTPLQTSGGKNGFNGIAQAGMLLATDPSGLSSIMSLLGSFDVAANVSNVLKYGLSSWGAAKSPESIKGKIEEYTGRLNSIVNQLKTSNNANSLQANINELERASKYYAKMSEASLDRRSWAGSTKAAFRVLDNTFDKYYNDVVVTVINSLRNGGVQFNETITSTKFGDVDNIYQPNVSESNTTAEKNGSYQHKYYTITAMPQASIAQTIGGNQPTTYDANGNPTNKPSGSSNINMGKILGFSGVAALAAFLVVPMMNDKGKTKKSKTKENN